MTSVTYKNIQTYQCNNEESTWLKRKKRKHNTKRNIFFESRRTERTKTTIGS